MLSAVLARAAVHVRGVGAADGTQKDAIERGGSIEVFPDAHLAKGRAEYIQGVPKNSGLGAEYDYLHGPVLVRVTGNLSSSRAQDYERALG